MKQEHGEISIWELLLTIKKIFSYSKNQYKKILILWSAGFLVFYFYLNFNNKKYVSDMYISARNMNRQELTSQVLYLNSLINYNNIDELATSLKISKTEASAISKFTIEPFKVDENSVTRDEAGNIKDVNESKITVQAKDNKIFEKLNNTLVQYLNYSQYSTLLNSSQSYQLQTLINTYSNEILRLDSIENKKNTKYKLQKEDGLNFLFDGPSEVAKARISLIEKIAKTDRDLKTDIGVKVIKQFYFPSKPQNIISNFEFVLIYVFVVFITILIVSFAKYLNDKLRTIA
ncbi:MAG: hypothetical protein U0V72_12260 [Cytophagales bacterium]